MKYYIYVLIGVCALMTACNKDNPDYLPKANGKPGEIVLIVDSLQWNDSLGTALRNIFNAEVPGLPQDEPMFSVIYVHPQKILGC